MFPERNVCSQQPRFASPCKGKTEPDQFSAVLDMPVENPLVVACHFCGKWTNSNGDGVEVVLDEDAQLRATLVNKNGRKIPLRIYGTSDGWLCGNAFLASASNDKLHWKSKHGVSIWSRREALHLPQQAMVSEPLAQVDESFEDSLSGCRSPCEVYFNPRPSDLGFDDSRPVANPFGLEEQRCSAHIPLFPFHPEERISSEELVIGNVWKMSQRPKDCRKVQEALSKGDNLSRAKIASELRGHVWESVESPHANHVIQRCIVVLPPEASEFIIDELKSWNGGSSAIYLAKHRFGCRIFERLLEHCPNQVEEMVGELLVHARALCVHQFGNYMMQHIFEYGSIDQKHTLATSLQGCIASLCCNECGVAVIGKALEHAPVEEQQSIADVLLKDEDRFIQLALRRYGHAAVKALLMMSGPAGKRARQVLGEHQHRLTTRHGRTVWRLVNDSEPVVCQQQRVIAAMGGS